MPNQKQYQQSKTSKRLLKMQEIVWKKQLVMKDLNCKKLNKTLLRAFRMLDKLGKMSMILLLKN